MPDTTYTCANEVLLTADSPNGSGKWEVIRGAGNITTPNGNETPVLITDKSQPLEVKWTVTSSVCPSAEDTALIIPITFNPGEIPNVITPNNDGMNDRWKIPNIELVQNKVRLYDRWGLEVFNTSNYKNNWSGKDLAPGVYFFFVNVAECELEFKGWVNIVN